MKYNIAVIGLATMGKNLVLNLVDHDYSVAVFNRTTSVTEEFINNNPNNNLQGFKTLEDLINNLEKPRKILLMIKAGKAVDLIIDNLIPLLDKNDIIMDGGNSFFQDTQRRYEYLKSKNIRYLGVGISGGETGARFGPAIMPGGDKEAYSQVEKILTDIAAKKNGQPCCNYTSDGGAGHFVKMIHNGIEYADMQLIAESFEILDNNFSREEVIEIFNEYKNSELSSYLIDITYDILKVKDKETKNYLLDMILDKSGQKGTGMWTSLEAIKLQVDCGIIISSLNARYNSNYKDLRTKISKNIISKKNNYHYDNLKEDLKNALYVAKILAYTQGFRLLLKSCEEYGFQFIFSDVAKIFQAGCIIRAKLLKPIINAYNKNNELESLILDNYFNEIINKNIDSLRKIVKYGIDLNIPMPAFSSALAYIDTMSKKDSSAKLIQAQRDYFGAHTVKRIDKKEEEIYHYNWDKYE